MKTDKDDVVYNGGNLVDLILQIGGKAATNYLHNLTQVAIDFPNRTKIEVHQ